MGLFGKSWDDKFDKQSAQQEKLLGMENAFTERMWNQTNDWNLAQWNRENEYNSPVEQMKRLAMAGINPNNSAGEIAGQNSASSLQSSAPGSAAAPGVPDPSGTDIMSNVSGAFDSVKTAVDAYKTIKAEIPNIEADTDVKGSEVRKNNADTLLTDQKRENLVEELRGMKFENVFIKPATWESILKNNKLTEAKVDEVRQNIENLKSENDLIKKQQVKMDADIEIARQQVNYWKEAVKVAVSEQDRNYAEAQYARAKKHLTEVETQGAEFDNQRKENDNKYRKELQDLGIDPDEHNTDLALGKQTAVNNARAAKKEFKENLGKNHLKWVDHGDGTGHAEHIITGRIIPVDDKGRPKSKGKGNTSYVRYRSNNHANPSWSRGYGD